eukprot:15029879-Heterocapsa_arctica.AAC.1
MNGIRAENTAHLASIAVLEAARSASEALSCVQRESIVVDKTLIEELTWKCSSNDHDCKTLTAELDVLRTHDPRVNGEHPDIVMLVDLNKNMISRCQIVTQESAQVRLELEDQAKEASNVIMNWEMQNQELRNIITLLEDHMSDHLLDEAARSPSPDRARG